MRNSAEKFPGQGSLLLKCRGLPGITGQKTQPIISRTATESQQILSPKDSSAASLRKFGKRYRASLRNHAMRAGLASLYCPATRERPGMSPPPSCFLAGPQNSSAADILPERSQMPASPGSPSAQVVPNAAVRGPDGLRGRKSLSIIGTHLPRSRGRGVISTKFAGKARLTAVGKTGNS